MMTADCTPPAQSVGALAGDRGYTFRRCAVAPAPGADWGLPPWRTADELAVACFHARSSDYRPRTLVRGLHDGDSLYLSFRVHDRHVRSTVTAYNGGVCCDSCVEFFVEPVPGRGYLNFEVNAGGTLHLSHITDPTPAPDGFASRRMIPEEESRGVRIHHTMPRVVDPELTDPVEWRIDMTIPIRLLEGCVGPLRPLGERTWRANFYKCGDHTSHPHWASWAPIGAQLRFHVPEYFAPIRFA